VGERRLSVSRPINSFVVESSSSGLLNIKFMTGRGLQNSPALQSEAFLSAFLAATLGVEKN
jgi:hypothetical protein